MAMYLSAAVTIVIGIVLGALVDPLLFAIVLLAPVDLLIARQFARAPAPPGDPSHNPYARED
jgi:hypothetical protein